ncbi:hypothetical protein Ahia01_000382500 [Argonauta hians]
MLTFAGNDLNDIVENFTPAQVKPENGGSHFDKLVEAITDHFNPRVNEEIQRYTFRQLRQQTDNIDDFYTELSKLAPTCEFSNVEDEIKSQIIVGCRSSRVREKGLTSPHLKLPELLQFARTLELTKKHIQLVENEERPISHKLGVQQNKNRTKTDRHHRKPPSPGQKCRMCGRNWPHAGGQKNCPAIGKTCHTCGRQNHFSSECRSKGSQGAATGPRIQTTAVKNNAGTESDSADDYVFIQGPRRKEMPIFSINIQGQSIDILADSGASTNILPTHHFNRLNHTPRLEKCDTKVYPFSSTVPLKVRGKFQTEVSYNGHRQQVYFLVVDTTDIPILSWKTSQDLRLLTTVNKIDGDVESHYQDVFTGLGKLKDQLIHLHIDTSVQPVAQRYRKIPFHMRKQLDEHLDREIELGVIEKATGPTPWVSPLVIVPKPKSPNKIRVCVDMRAPNKAIKRECHNMPTFDELATLLSGAKFFSKLDLNQGYNQLELDEESRYITMFATHRGLYRFRRLNFGVNSAAEVFQEAICQALNGLPGVTNVSDDILVFGKDQQSHETNLRGVLQRLREKNLTLNRDKCQYMKPSIEFLGHIFCADGMQPCPNKLKQIAEIPAPTMYLR